jgi:excinuclease ABC subunit C
MEQLSEMLQKKIKNLPGTPGVYIMRDKEGGVIYVGKARILKNRVRQYFSHENQLPKVAAMVAHIDDFEYIITDTELEALVLECNLIKQYRPYYNILLKDDKHFPYIRIDLTEDYPKVEVVRSVGNDAAKYYGPFVAAHVIRDVLDHIYRLYPLRSCGKEIARAIERGERPCLNYEMGRCIGPCTGKISRKEYGVLVHEVMDVISGDKAALKREMTKQMDAAAEALNFELAATLRDKIALIDRIREKQRVGFPNLDDKDVFAVETGKETAVIQAFLFRDGKLCHAQKYDMNFVNEGRSEIMKNFLQQYYIDKRGIPKRIYTLPRPQDVALIAEWLSKKRGARVHILEAKKGDNKKLTELAKKNAGEAIRIQEGIKKVRQAAAENLARALGIDRELKRIECYDISNIQGTDSVASMVVFTDGQPDKKKYRRFRIKEVLGANDFASMNEVLTRRLLRGRAGNAGFIPLPDLIIVDGGKGQLSAAVDALAAVGYEEIPIVGLAKKQETLFLPDAEESILLPVTSPQYRLVTGIRDEAHRFAVDFHRKLREKRMYGSELDGIAGIGEVRKKKLLRYFGSLKKIKLASIEDLKSVSGIPGSVAERLFEKLHNNTDT